jgi:predicted RNA-binding protein YlqC (UPF0109 family)
MKELVEFLVKNIVENEKDVLVEEKADSDGVKFLLTVAPEDMGKVIGKNGRVIKALRTLVRVKGIKDGQRVFLEIADKESQDKQATTQ